MSTDDHTPDESTDYEHDADQEFADEADWGLEDTKASEEPVRKSLVIGGERRRLDVIEATEAEEIDAEDLADDPHGFLAEYFREHVTYPSSFADCSAEDVKEMRKGTADKLYDKIAPETAGQRLGNLL